MAQATLDDDDLFGEAAGELRADVEEHIEAGWNALPDADAIWSAEADNVLGVLNTLRKKLEIEDAREHVRDAKKWYTVGDRADAFDDGDDLTDRLAQLESTIDRIEAVSDDVSELASELPALRESLETASHED